MLLVLFAIVAVSVAAGFFIFNRISQNESSNEGFFEDVSRLVTDNWSNNFFSIKVLTVNDPYMNIDGQHVLIDPETRYAPVIVGDKMRLPRRALLVDDNELHTTHNYAEHGTMTVDGAFLYIDLGLGAATHSATSPYARANNFGYEVNWDEQAGQLTLTRNFQTSRLIAQTSGPIDLAHMTADEIIHGSDNIIMMQFASMSEAMSAYAQLTNMDNVLWVEPDLIITTTSSPHAAVQSSEHLSWGAERIGADQYAAHLRNNGITGQITVAVVDTGVDSHTFLSGRLVNGWNFVSGNAATHDIHSRGHGTPVAGVIVDSTPGLNVRIMPIMVFHRISPGEYRAAFSNVANGVEWAVTNGARVINLSLGSRGSMPNFMARAINIANDNNAVVVTSAGNDGINAREACIASSADVITVAATDYNNMPVNFPGFWSTNWGSPVDISAPGAAINSSVFNEDFESTYGTSISAPFMSAVVAMYMLDNPYLTSEQIRNAIVRYVHVPNGWNTSRYGAGIIDISRAIYLDAPTPIPQPTPSPTPEPTPSPSLQPTPTPAPEPPLTAEGISVFRGFDRSGYQVLEYDLVNRITHTGTRPPNIELQRVELTILNEDIPDGMALSLMPLGMRDSRAQHWSGCHWDSGLRFTLSEDFDGSTLVFYVTPGSYVVNAVYRTGNNRRQWFGEDIINITHGGSYSATLAMPSLPLTGDTSVFLGPGDNRYQVYDLDTLRIERTSTRPSGIEMHRVELTILYDDRNVVELYLVPITARDNAAAQGRPRAWRDFLVTSDFDGSPVIFYVTPGSYAVIAIHIDYRADGITEMRLIAGSTIDITHSGSYTVTLTQ